MASAAVAGHAGERGAEGTAAPEESAAMMRQALQAGREVSAAAALTGQVTDDWGCRRAQQAAVGRHRRRADGADLSTGRNQLEPADSSSLRQGRPEVAAAAVVDAVIADAVVGGDETGFDPWQANIEGAGRARRYT
jgi:hypothetical protein